MRKISLLMGVLAFSVCHATFASTTPDLKSSLLNNHVAKSSSATQESTMMYAGQDIESPTIATKHELVSPGQASNLG